MKYFDQYIRLLHSLSDIQRPLSVVFDASNGTTGPILKTLFRGSRYRMINARVDGAFPAHGPNPLAPGGRKMLQDAVKTRNADMGIIFDADGDRVFFVDDRGRNVDPDVILYILAMEESGKFCIDVRTGWLIRRHIPNHRWRVVPVGHANIKREMKRFRAPLAGERSGHYYFAFSAQKLRGARGVPLYIDSGMIAAVKMVSFASSLEQSFSAYIDSLPRFYRSGERNMRVTDIKKAQAILRDAYAKRTNRISTIDGLTIERENMWFNIRKSGTENVVRLNMEATSPSILSAELARVKWLIQ